MMPVQLVDTHSHIYLEDFDTDRQDVLVRAAAENIVRILLPNIDSRSIAKLKHMVQTNPGTCLPMMGLHPTSVKENYREEFEIIRNELLTGNYCAVGEIGIDLYWSKKHMSEQCFVFEQEIELALEKDLPVAIHARESMDVIFEILQKFTGKGLRGVFHAFTGNTGQARHVIDMGFRLGIGGILTYKNSGLDKVVKDVGLEHIVLETDSPFLPPVPKRGMRNEPAFVRFTAEKLAEIKGIGIAEVGSVTTHNAFELFRING